MSDTDKIIEQIKKLQELAARGEYGERINARELINSLMDKYSITPDMLEVEDRRRFEFKYKYEWQWSLMDQLIALVGDDKVASYVRSKKIDGVYKRVHGLRLLECTPEVWVDLISRYEIYQRSYAEHLKAFFRSFLIANDLLLPYDPNAPMPDEKEQELFDRANAMALGVDKCIIHKQLEQEGADR